MSNRAFDNGAIDDQESGECQTTGSVFDDPVAYLAQFGIVAELTQATSLPTAA
ncbi:MAG TPA: hypothetical protein VMM14_01885 [Acidimicrobiia bacterium]|nr:hypothetical protein [Acidimicrobiia bacterium]